MSVRCKVCLNSLRFAQIDKFLAEIFDKKMSTVPEVTIENVFDKEILKQCSENFKIGLALKMIPLMVENHNETTKSMKDCESMVDKLKQELHEQNLKINLEVNSVKYLNEEIEKLKKAIGTNEMKATIEKQQ